MSFVTRNAIPFVSEGSTSFVEGGSTEFLVRKTSRTEDGPIVGWGVQPWGTSPWGTGYQTQVTVELDGFVSSSPTPFLEEG